MKNPVQVFANLGVLASLLLSASALAASPVLPAHPAHPAHKDDADFFCQFYMAGNAKVQCRASGRFESVKPKKNQILMGDDEDHLNVRCGDFESNTDDELVYNDTVRRRLKPDADDVASIQDTLLLGVSPGAPVITLQALDWTLLKGRFGSTLEIWREGDHLTYQGNCKLIRVLE